MLVQKSIFFVVQPSGGGGVDGNSLPWTPLRYECIYTFKVFFILGTGHSDGQARRVQRSFIISRCIS